MQIPMVVFFFFVTKESTRKQQERGKFEPGSCELNNQVGKKKKNLNHTKRQLDRDKFRPWQAQRAE